MMSPVAISDDVVLRMRRIVEAIMDSREGEAFPSGSSFNISMWDIPVEELSNLQSGYPLVVMICGGKMIITTEAALELEVDFSKRKAN